jgi:hypothetical protein
LQEVIDLSDVIVMRTLRLIIETIPAIIVAILFIGPALDGFATCLAKLDIRFHVPVLW